MNQSRLRHFNLLSIVCLAAAGLSAGTGEPRYIVLNRAIHRIDPKLFGHFMERPSWGEIGVEGALVPGTSKLQPGVLDKLREMRIPILRFPGGTDADVLDWRDMIDHAPGREPSRPKTSVGHQGNRVGNRFGYDEFLRLCRELKAEPLLVVNLGDALLRRRPLKEAALRAASLAAYCNLAEGAPRPEGMEDWPAARARNGSPEPYGARYFQVGNETWFIVDEMRRRGEKDPEGFYLECLEAYVGALRAVDPSIRIVADAVSERIAEGIRDRLGDRVNYLVQHDYAPWGIAVVERAGKAVPVGGLSEEEIWNAWTAIPQAVNERGESMIGGTAVDLGRKFGYRVAITEWNWNGWWNRGWRPKPMTSSFAKGVGAAGYLHAFMRAGDVVEIACQSMTVGNVWGITGIRADPEGRTLPYFLPTGQVTMFYARHHGDALLETRAEGVPTYAQPLRMGLLEPKEKVAVVDALATADDQAIYFHAINRRFDAAQPVTIDLSAFAGLPGKAVHHRLEGRLNDRPESGEPVEMAWFKDEVLSFDGKVLRVTLPARSVSCVEIPK